MEAEERPVRPSQRAPFDWQPQIWLGSLACVAAAAGLGLLVREAIGIGSISLLFLTAVLVSAVLFGLWPALFACVICYARL